MTQENVSAAVVKELRERTGQPMMACKEALAQAGGDMDKAVEILRKAGMAVAARKASRQTREGRIASYIHHTGRLGVLIEVNCETDFVAKSSVFTELVRDLCMQVASANPEYLRREDVPGHILEKEQEICREQVRDKPAAVQERIVAGRMDKWFAERVLLEQAFIRDDTRTVREVVSEAVSKTGENITVARFVRFALGET